MTGASRILVIKHGALGDLVLATGPMKAIRAHHAGAQITLLTARPYAALLKPCPFFDHVWIDEKPKALHIRKWMTLARRLRSGGFERVYDLQTSTRSTLYYRFFRPRFPEWSGMAKGGSHYCGTPERPALHAAERQKRQLAIAGIADVPEPDVSWLKSAVALPPAPYALLVPGGAAHRPEKRWPAGHYAEAARWMTPRGITPVLIGTAAERDTLDAIAAACPKARNLCDRTSFAEIAALARGAALALGNDTGPMHLIAAAGCPSVVLFSRASDPALCAPCGPHVGVLRAEALAALTPETVIAQIYDIMEKR